MSEQLPTDHITPLDPPMVIAIDGPAGSGKSTVGRRLAADLGLEYLDTGAMYRGVTFAALRRGIDPADGEVVGRLALQVELTLTDGAIVVDGVDATIEIRGPEVTRAVARYGGTLSVVGNASSFGRKQTDVIYRDHVDPA